MRKYTELEEGVETTEQVRALADQLRARAHELAAEAVETLEQRVPDYLLQLGFDGENPVEVSRADIDAIAGVLATTGRPLPRDLIKQAVDIGRRRARQGVTLEHLLEADVILREVAVKHLEAALLEQPDHADTLALAERRLDSHRDAAILALTRGYLAGHAEGFEREHRELAALMSIMRAVSRSLEAGEIADAAVAETCRAMGLEQGVIWLTPRERPESLVTLRTFGLDRREDAALGSEMPIPAELEEALLSDLPVQLQLDPRNPGFPGTRSILAVALRGRGDTVGLMVVGAPGEREFNAHDIAFAALVGEHVGVALANAEQHVREARTDHLTGLANRPEFERAVQRQIAASKRYGRPLTVLLLDLDNLKLINDTYGHHWGDAAIQAVARSLRSVVRASDVCARLGGDEFGLVMPEAGTDEAEVVISRVRQALDAASREADLPEPAGISIGFATWQAGTDWKQLLLTADERLYVDKRSRRVRSTEATP
jgi:diguanylate cyclase (GGDEF)-like protein